MILLTVSSPARHSDWTPGSVAVVERGDEPGHARLGSKPTLLEHARIKVHGSSSRAFAKKQLRLRLTNATGEKLDRPLLGMPKANTWVLHAPYADKTLLRNALAYRWSRAQGDWAPRTRLVELYLDDGGGPIDSGDYRGVYVVVERVEVAPERVAIAPLRKKHTQPPAISGGYLFRQDNLDSDDTTFQSAAGISYRLDAPSRRAVKPEQIAYLGTTVDAFEEALFGAAFTDAERGYAAHIDVDSFVDHLLLVELTKNSDGFKKSTYFHKERNGPLRSGPVWDYNVALRNGRRSVEPHGWIARAFQRERSPYWPRLLQDPAFDARVRERWQELRAGPWSTDRLLADIAELVRELGEAPERNFERWPILGERIFTNPDTSASHAEEIGKLETWLRARLAWLDERLTGPAAARAILPVAPMPMLSAVEPQPKVAVRGPGTARLPKPLPKSLRALELAVQLRMPYPETGSMRASLRLTMDRRPTVPANLPFDRPGADDGALSVGLLTTAPPIRNEVAVRWRGHELFRRGLGRHVTDFGAGEPKRLALRLVAVDGGTRLTLLLEAEEGLQHTLVSELPVSGFALGGQRVEMHATARQAGSFPSLEEVRLRTASR